MEYKEAVELEKRCFAQVFGRLPLLLTKGKGSYVYDDKGRRYYDMFAGIAVSSVGHAHPKVVKAISAQAGKLMHVSNWVYSEPQLVLAKKLTGLTGMERVFLTNDGTSAVEGAFKLARKVSGKPGIISMEHSFHGRTMGALSATWAEKYRKPFEPLVPGFKFARYDDLDSLQDAIDKDTGAVIVEPILGEGGVKVPLDGYLKGVRDITHDKGALMIVDEVQTGFGRTGVWFDYKRAGIEPDILVLAKGLGGGFPIGALMYSGMDFEKGQHGGTFNGSPLACTVANTVIDIIKKEKLVENSKKVGDAIKKELEGHSIHGRGLMLGLDVEDGPKTVLELIKRGVVTIHSQNTLRMLPALNIKRREALAAVKIIKEVL